jgi:hypothetical protein
MYRREVARSRLFPAARNAVLRSAKQSSRVPTCSSSMNRQTTLTHNPSNGWRPSLLTFRAPACSLRTTGISWTRSPQELLSSRKENVVRTMAIILISSSIRLNAKHSSKPKRGNETGFFGANSSGSGAGRGPAVQKQRAD